MAPKAAAKKTAAKAIVAPKAKAAPQPVETALQRRIRLADGVRVGDGTIIENVSELDLIIPEKAEIPARSHITNDGFGTPRYVRG